MKLGSMFALPRCVYAMAEDGLLFKTFAQINEKTQASISSRLLLENLHGTLKLNQFYKNKLKWLEYIKIYLKYIEYIKILIYNI